ncbi:MAG: OmpA family protein [Gammaproteobacteria bacterium]|nr:OmpA family protein [Gammaproteobacteria bacterium]MBU1553218.1 OmpA family protein [Gammaproteobacteria bacterium]MBU2069615.1 OmpA family protein [Gammaproteobacteria bacterium]MBU2184480.1 OmpA family protein [Gammaproteobacteria bacterium]MBU2205162.1 OmpA family protein [Gammaproteobacteria bacterium]
MYRHKQRHKHVEHEQLDRWLVSYADYMTLMFALFVVLYAMAMIKEEQYSVLANSLTKIFDKPAEADSGVSGQSVLVEATVQSEFDLHGSSLEQAKGPELVADARQLSEIAAKKLGSPLQSIEQQLTQALANLLQQGVAKLQQDENWLTIELNSGLLFASGSATTTPSASVLLAEISRIIAPISNFIRVRGYTDNQPINNELFASNWELSVSRATSVLRLLEQLNVAPARLAIEGYGQYYPFAANDTVRGRAENRKVVIAISRYGYQQEASATAEPSAADIEQTEALQQQLEQVSQQDGTIRVIALPGGGIRITTREDNPDAETSQQQDR